MTNTGKMNFIFQNGSKAVGDGFELMVNSGFNTVNIEITGTGTSTLTFEGKSVSDGSWYPVMCVNLSTLTLATTTTGKGELWQCDLTGLTKFRVRVSAFTSGSVNVKGRVVE